MMLQFIAGSLKKQNYEVLTASDGKQAIELMESERPDLIVSDVLMPFLTGIELSEYVRHKLRWTTPILLISGAGQRKMVLDSLISGANNFIRKPIDITVLLFWVKCMLLYARF